jgi:hypothetical protein
MRRHWRRALTVTLLAAAGLAALRGRPSRAPGAGLSGEDRRAALLADAFAKGEARRAVKVQLVEELAEGRLSLREAVARLRDYHNQEGSHIPAGAPEAWYGRGSVGVLGGPEEERCARSLIAHVGQWLRNSPALRGEVLARLEREAAELLRGAESPAP